MHSHQSTNPRNYRLLIRIGNILPSPLTDDCELTILDAGLPTFCVIIGENKPVSFKLLFEVSSQIRLNY